MIRVHCDRCNYGVAYPADTDAPPMGQLYVFVATPQHALHTYQVRWEDLTSGRGKFLCERCTRDLDAFLDGLAIKPAERLP